MAHAALRSARRGALRPEGCGTREAFGLPGDPRARRVRARRVRLRRRAGRRGACGAAPRLARSRRGAGPGGLASRGDPGPGARRGDARRALRRDRCRAGRSRRRALRGALERFARGRGDGERRGVAGDEPRRDRRRGGDRRGARVLGLALRGASAGVPRTAGRAGASRHGRDRPAHGRRALRRCRVHGGPDHRRPRGRGHRGYDGPRGWRRRRNPHTRGRALRPRVVPRERASRFGRGRGDGARRRPRRERRRRGRTHRGGVRCAARRRVGVGRGGALGAPIEARRRAARPRRHRSLPRRSRGLDLEQRERRRGAARRGHAADVVHRVGLQRSGFSSGVRGARVRARRRPRARGELSRAHLPEPHELRSGGPPGAAALAAHAHRARRRRGSRGGRAAGSAGRVVALRSAPPAHRAVDGRRQRVAAGALATLRGGLRRRARALRDAAAAHDLAGRGACPAA